MTAALRTVERPVFPAFFLILAAAVALVSAPSGSAAQAALTGHPNTAAAKHSSRHSSQNSMIAVGSFSSSQGVKTVQGIAQSVHSSSIDLKELNGNRVTVSVDSKTRILVNGKNAALSDIQPGYVVTATLQDGKPARELNAIAVSSTSVGGAVVVQSASSGSVVVTAPDGTTVTIRVDSKTRVYVDGKSAKLGDVRRGYVLSTRLDSLKRDRAAGELRFLRSSH